MVDISSQLAGQYLSSGFKNPNGDANWKGHKQGVKPCPRIIDTTLTCAAGSTAGNDDFWVDDKWVVVRAPNMPWLLHAVTE